MATLHKILSDYGLRTYHLDRELGVDELGKIIEACETIVGPSRDKWLSDLESQKAQADMRQKTLEDV